MHKEPSTQQILAHSYSFYLLLLLISFFLDVAFPIKIFNSSLMTPVGIGLLVVSTILIFWAQVTSRHLDKAKEVSVESFCRGPYCYTRSPTHWGLFLLMLGFGITINAFFVILSSLISLIITKTVFLKKQEKMMVEIYGDIYSQYKKLVKF